jgi:hypothetical protein
MITKEQMFRERVQNLLGSLQGQYPTLFVPVELYRLNVVSFNPTEAIDDMPEVFIRLDPGPGTIGFNYQTMDRWYQADVGLIQQKVNNLIVSGDYDLQPDDHVIIQGVAYMVVDAQNILGVCKAKIDLPKARWNKQPRGTPTYRQIGIQAYIE